MAENQARLHPGSSRVSVDVKNTAEIPGAIYDKRGVDSLAALTCTGAPRQHGYAFFPGNRHCSDHVVNRLWDNDPDRLNLVDRSVGAIASSAGSIEQDLPCN